MPSVPDDTTAYYYAQDFWLVDSWRPHDIVLKAMHDISEATDCSADLRSATIGKHRFVYVGFKRSPTDHDFRVQLEKWITTNPNVIVCVEGYVLGNGVVGSEQRYPIEEMNLCRLINCAFLLAGINADISKKAISSHTKKYLTFFLDDLKLNKTQGVDILKESVSDEILKSAKEIVALITNPESSTQADLLAEQILQTPVAALAFFNMIISDIIDKRVVVADPKYKTLTRAYINDPFDKKAKNRFIQEVVTDARNAAYVQNIASVARLHVGKVIIVLVSSTHVDRQIPLLDAALNASVNPSPATLSTTTTTTQPPTSASSTDGKTEAPTTTPTVVV